MHHIMQIQHSNIIRVWKVQWTYLLSVLPISIRVCLFCQVVKETKQEKEKNPDKTTKDDKEE